VSKDKTMKKVVYIIVSLIAFMFGASVYYVRPLFVPISLSVLRENISHYRHLKIKVVAKLEVTEENSRYFINLKDWENDCSGDNFCFQGLELSDEVLAQNISLIKELVEKNKTVERSTLINGLYWADGEYFVEVEVIGRFVEKENELFGGTFYDIKVEEIKQKSPIKFVPIKEMLGR
jgi:hypothetical protein